MSPIGCEGGKDGIAFCEFIRCLSYHRAERFKAYHLLRISSANKTNHQNVTQSLFLLLRSRPPSLFSRSLVSYPHFLAIVCPLLVLALNCSKHLTSLKSHSLILTITSHRKTLKTFETLSKPPLLITGNRKFKKNSCDRSHVEHSK